MALPIEELGRLMLQKRGSRGIRAAAAEAEISPAKICRWLGVDPATFLGVDTPAPAAPRPAVVHFRKKKTVSVDTAQSLAELILAAQKAKDARLELMRR